MNDSESLIPRFIQKMLKHFAVSFLNTYNCFQKCNCFFSELLFSDESYSCDYFIPLPQRKWNEGVGYWY
jgi:hypothetical protein